MKRLSLLAGGALALFSVAASAIDHQVVAMNTPNRHFEPPTLTINVGDTVTFINDPGNPGFHNVVSDTGSVTQFRCANGCDGDGGNGDPDSNLWSATVTFPTAGSVPYLCEVHGIPGGGGMYGTITVVGNGTPVLDLSPGALTGAADEGASTVVPLSIGNTGDADLTWNADPALSDCATPETIPWLSLDPTSGTVVVGDPATTVDVTLDASALAPGVYNADVCVHSNDEANALVPVPVEFTVNVSAADQIFTNGFDP
ncbi:MAG TPA: plastocyanin/azurin family copper-binding protein [Rhodanobacteraceae bacterium]|nr:plastocyanin/azurin family copper-binding protein [Rhodanobacteraceae bacterium]